MRLAVDIGGTFSDIVVMDDAGRVRVRKAPSTPDNYARGVLAGIQALIAETGISPAQISSVVHSTTVGTNTILQRNGELTCLITTKGFRDVLELGRIRLPVLYNLRWEKPIPLIRRAHRLEVDERISTRGEIIGPLDSGSVLRAIDHLRRYKIRSVAICLLNSYINPVHERQVAQLVRNALPDCVISLSHEVLPEIQEFERTSTTVADAYIKRSLSFYLKELGAGLEQMGISGPLTVMHSNGGMLSLRSAVEMPVITIESGPAAGVVAACSLSRAAGISNAISFDMGGTTAKASLLENGEILRSSEYEVGGEVSASSRLIRGSGYLIRIPVIDVSEVGNGGGSYVRANRGRLQVGPKSAGAVPGPACYGKGNDLPTVTDANVVLGYINPEHLVGGAIRIDFDRSVRAIRHHIAEPLGLTVEAAAYGVHLLAVSNMMRAVRTVSVERGRDPREFILVAFGGNGPLHCANMARALGMSQILIPLFAGLFSAIGLLSAGFELSFVKGSLVPLDDLRSLRSLVEAALLQAKERYLLGGNPMASCRLDAAADIRYRGQSSHLTLPIPDDYDVKALADAFHTEHARSFGYASPGDPVELVSIRTTVRGPSAEVRWHALTGVLARNDATRRTRRAYFGPKHGWLETAVIERGALGLEQAEGPLIVDEYDSTTIVPPNARAHLDELKNIRLEVRDEEGA